MTDKSVFSDEEWHALTDAPLLITLALFAPESTDRSRW